MAAVRLAALSFVGAVVVAGAAAWIGSAADHGSANSATEADFRRVVFARGFDSPVHIVSTAAEPRRLYVVEQRGTIRVLQDGRLRPGFFLDIRDRVVAGGEQGLLGLAFDPRFAQNRYLYVNYTDRVGDTRIVRFRAAGGRARRGSARLLLHVDQPFANHNGGNIVFGPDGRLWVGLGDGGSGGDPRGDAQNMGTFLGKMLRLDVRRPGSRPDIFGLGLRNPWRYSFDRATGDLYVADVGQGAVEEVHFTRAGTTELQNYGWNLFEGSRRFSAGEPSRGRLVFPVYEYGRENGNCTVVGGFVYRGRARPAERGRYVFGDYCSGMMWAVDAAGPAPQDPVVLARTDHSISSFGVDAEGRLYMTDLNGELLQITAAP